MNSLDLSSLTPQTSQQQEMVVYTRIDYTQKNPSAKKYSERAKLDIIHPSFY